jgi:tetratricopeptide (TPR) repeat protein
MNRDDLMRLAETAGQEERWEDAIEWYSQLIADSASASCFYNRGSTYARLDNLDAAICDFNAAISLGASVIAGKIYSNRGNAFYHKKKYQQAMVDLTESIRIEPTAHSYYTRGLVNRDQQDYEAAQADFSRAIEFDPNHANAWGCLGFSHQKLGQYGPAIAAYTEANRLNPDDAGILINRGNTFVSIGKYEEGIFDLKTAISKDPLKASAQNNLASALLQSGGNTEDAIRACSKSIKLSERKLLEPFLNRAAAHCLTQNPDLAIKDYKSALKLNSSRAQTHRQLGIVYGSAENFQKALKHFRLAHEQGVDCSFYIQNLEDEQKHPELMHIIANILEELKVKDSELTHYTSLETAQKLLIEGCCFQISNAKRMNDPLEGAALRSFLELKSEPQGKYDVRTYSGSNFYIGSFSLEKNSLDLFRLYGKSNGVEGAGCAISFRKTLLDDVPPENEVAPSVDLLRKPYKIAYCKNDEFYVDGKVSQTLSHLFNQLRLELKKDKDPQTPNEIGLLDRLLHLVKSHHYQSEKECRVVIPDSHVKSDAKIDKQVFPPRVYYELSAPVLDHVTEIIIGPNAKDADAWALAFSTKLKGLKKNIPIKVSTLPYR